MTAGAVALAPTPCVSVIPTHEEAVMLEAAVLTSECAKFAGTDTGNGKRFALRHSDKARYCAIRGSWFLWDGKRWKPDAGRHVRELAKATAVAINSEVELIGDKHDRGARQTWAKASESVTRINAMLTSAETDPAIRIEPDELDYNPDLINLQNGTFNLSTLEPQPHNPDDLITKVANVSYDKDADCPAWKAHLISCSMATRP